MTGIDKGVDWVTGVDDGVDVRPFDRRTWVEPAPKAREVVRQLSPLFRGGNDRLATPCPPPGMKKPRRVRAGFRDGREGESV